MLDFLNGFRRGLPFKRGSITLSDRWRIDLKSLGGAIVPVRAEAMNLPRPAPRPKKTPKAEKRAEKSVGVNAASQYRGPTDYLAVHNVEKSFVGRKVVKGVSLSVRGGEAVGLLGSERRRQDDGVLHDHRSDRGRSRQHRTRRPRRHQAADVSARAPRHRLSAAGSFDLSRAQCRRQHPRRARSGRAEPQATRADLDALLEEFNITRLRKTPSIALSGGERRRVEIARALATRPNYMLLDEPFAGIDPIAVGDIQALVRHLTQRGIGVLITDHNVRETLGLTDRAYIIYSGEVLMEGRADDIVNNPDVRRLYLGDEFRL